MCMYKKNMFLRFLYLTIYFKKKQIDSELLQHVSCMTVMYKFSELLFEKSYQNRYTDSLRTQIWQELFLKANLVQFRNKINIKIILSNNAMI